MRALPPSSGADMTRARASGSGAFSVVGARLSMKTPRARSNAVTLMRAFAALAASLALVSRAFVGHREPYDHQARAGDAIASSSRAGVPCNSSGN